MKKKVLSLCLALALLCALPFSAPGAKAISAGQYTLAVGEAYAKTGERAELGVTVEGDAPFFSMQGLLVFDRTRLELDTDGGAPVLTAAEGFVLEVLTDTFEDFTHARGVAFSLTTESGAPVSVSEATKVLTVSFLVKEEAALGDASVKLISSADEKSSTFVSAGDGVYGDVSYQSGKVSVMPQSYQRAEGGSPAAEYTVKTQVDGVVTEYAVSRVDVRLPGVILQNGRAVVAWKMGDKVYAPASAVILSEKEVVLEGVTVEVPKTVHGAAIKITPNPNDTALRFKTKISRADYDALVSLLGEENVSWGMIAAPQQNIDIVGACTYEAFAEHVAAGKQPYVCYPPKEEWADKWNKGAFSSFYVNDEEDSYTLIGAIGNFNDSNLRSGVRFNAVGYISISIGGESFRVYGDVDFEAARDVSYVVNCALAAYFAGYEIYTDDQVKWLIALKERCEG